MSSGRWFWVGWKTLFNIGFIKTYDEDTDVSYLVEIDV